MREPEPNNLGAIRVGALAIGAVAIGAFAFGAAHHRNGKTLACTFYARSFVG